MKADAVVACGTMVTAVPGAVLFSPVGYISETWIRPDGFAAAVAVVGVNQAGEPVRLVEDHTVVEVAPVAFAKPEM